MHRVQPLRCRIGSIADVNHRCLSIFRRRSVSSGAAAAAAKNQIPITAKQASPAAQSDSGSVSTLQMQMQALHAASKVKMRAFAASNRDLPSPAMVTDVTSVVDALRLLRDTYPDLGLHFALNAHPAPQLARALADSGCHVQAATLGQIKLAVEAGVDPQRIGFSTALKSAPDIQAAAKLGVRWFGFDSVKELQKLSAIVPGAAVVCHVQGHENQSVGCEPTLAGKLMSAASSLGLVPAGVSVFPSDSTDQAVSAATLACMSARAEGVVPPLLMVGDGAAATPDAIMASMDKYFQGDSPKLVWAPGKAFLAPFGTIVSQVILVAKRGKDTHRWVHLDVGKQHGLIDAHDSGTVYPLECISRSGPSSPVHIAGDDGDYECVMYTKLQHSLPNDLDEGDVILFHQAGASLCPCPGVNPDSLHHVYL